MATLTLTLPLSVIVVFYLFPWQSDVFLVIKDDNRQDNSPTLLAPKLFCFKVLLAAYFICHTEESADSKDFLFKGRLRLRGCPKKAAGE
jgi:hypothetical protein